MPGVQFVKETVQCRTHSTEFIFRRIHSRAHVGPAGAPVSHHASYVVDRSHDEPVAYENGGQKGEQCAAEDGQRVDFGRSVDRCECLFLRDASADVERVVWKLDRAISKDPFDSVLSCNLDDTWKIRIDQVLKGSRYGGSDKTLGIWHACQYRPLAVRDRNGVATPTPRSAILSCSHSKRRPVTSTRWATPSFISGIATGRTAPFDIRLSV